jgi:hypothetical protein
MRQGGHIYSADADKIYAFAVFQHSADLCRAEMCIISCHISSKRNNIPQIASKIFIFSANTLFFIQVCSHKKLNSIV